MIIVLLIRVGRGLGDVGGTFSCRFESMRCKVYFDIMKLLLPFLIFEFEVVILLVGIIGGYSVVIGVIVGVILIELLNQGFRV